MCEINPSEEDAWQNTIASIERSLSYVTLSVRHPEPVFRQMRVNEPLGAAENSATLFKENHTMSQQAQSFVAQSFAEKFSSLFLSTPSFFKENAMKTRSRSVLSVAVVALTALLTANSANAVPITVGNQSFEAPVYADAGNNLVNTGQTSWVNTATIAVIYNPLDGDMPGTTGDPGTDSIPGGTGHQISELQTGSIVAQNVGSIDSSTLYTLTTAVGRRISNVSFTDLTIELRASSAAGTVLGSSLIEASDLGANGVLSDFDLSFDSNDFAGEVTNDLFIVYTGSGSGTRAIIDNVRLEATATAIVPEPSSVILAALGLVGLVGTRRRRRHRG